MAKLGEFWRKLLFFLRRGQLDRDLEDEMRLHQELRARAHAEEGMPEEEARYTTRREFGNPLLLREKSRDVWGFNWLETLLQDLRYGLRQLRRNPGFTIVAIVTLALGIGANTAIFSVVNATLFRPLPFRNPGRIVWIRPKGSGAVAPADFLDWKRQNHVFSEISAYFSWGANLVAGGHSRRITRTICSANLFKLLGVQPALGRSFLPTEERTGHAPVAILSHSLWQQSFSGDRKAVGGSVTVNGERYTVVGVMPAGFHYPGQTEVWTPPAREVPAPPIDIGDVTKNHSVSYLAVIGRLAPGVAIGRARVEMDTIATRIANRYHEGSGKQIVLVEPLQQIMVGNVRPLLLILLGAVGLVLLIACANVANLMLCRARVRRTEMAVRSALGASRLRLVRQTLTESVLVALAGGVLGLLFSVAGTNLLLHMGSETLPEVQAGHIDGLVLGFTLAVSLLTGILFGLAPALGLAHVNLSESLKQMARRGRGERGLLRGSLAAAEIALSLILLAGAGLLLRSFISLSRQVRLGFDPQHVLTVSVAPTGKRYQTAAQQALFYGQALERLRALPGVNRAGVVNSLPPYSVSSGKINIAENGSSKDGRGPVGAFSIASPGYFQALQIPVLRGRTFSADDTARSPRVAVVNQTLAHEFFPHNDPIGKHVEWFTGRGRGKPEWLEIVGVVGDVKNFQPGVAVRPQVYACYEQASFNTGMSFVVQTTSSPAAMASAIRAAIQSTDAGVPVFRVAPLSQALARTLSESHFVLLLLGAFSVLAMLLAAIGIYGVVSYSVSQRTHEIGIRMALGAQRADVLRMVVRQGLKLAMGGVIIGIAGALALTRFLSSMLYDIKPTDPLTFIAVSLILIAVALLACYIPARRAAKVDPTVALRYE